ncbi:MAG: DUF1294 domain-containing protein [Blautia sp.]|nr:DUF1294 domain-containing protein [Blautia sp.]
MIQALIYLGIINIITFIAFGADKHKAKCHQWRIPESRLMLLAVMGGSLGALAGMFAFHHKTQKMKFCLGVPVILIIQCLILLYLMH